MNLLHALQLLAPLTHKAQWVILHKKQETVDLVAFTEEILNEKLHFSIVLGEFGRNKFVRLRL